MEGDLFLFQYFIIFHSCGWIHFQFQDYTLCMPLVNLISLFTKKRITFRVWAICNHVMPNHVVQCGVNKFLFIVCCWISNKKGNNWFVIRSFFIFLILFIALIMISFKLPLTALLISSISISAESDCDKWMEMGQIVTVNLILTLSVGCNVSCNNVGSVSQTITLFDYSFKSKSTNPRTVLEKKKSRLPNL